ncbi:MAG: transglutaminase domain-containing protein [bacterium]|nr:transglutaminase domain-containing protein [bacterium]
MIRRWCISLAAGLLAAYGLSPPGRAEGGFAIEGRDRARVLVPPGAVVTDYRNAGYRLVRVGEEAHIEIEATPLGSTVRFELPRRKSRDAVGRLARALTSRAETRYDAVTRVLGWVARHIEYSLNRRQPQSAEAVLSRRSGYCTGIARLTVALLRAVGIPAREVAGYVVGGEAEEGASGYHRWIEVYLPDCGWVFSDPLNSHHYVPATYLRLAGDQLATEQGIDGLLLDRVKRLYPVDQYPAAVPGITARRNSEHRLAAALRVRIKGWSTGRAVLIGDAVLRHHALIDGTTTFVGLDPGRYRLCLLLPGGGVLEHPVEIAGRGWTALELPVPTVDRAGLRQVNPRGRDE